MPKLCYVELAENGMPIRIFRSRKAWAQSDVPMLVQRDHGESVALIRWQVYRRDNESCVKCGKFLPWDGSLFEKAHMHHIMPLGNGGETSVSNCQILCYEHHINGEHGNRKPQWSKHVDTRKPFEKAADKWLSNLTYSLSGEKNATDREG